MNSSKKVPQQQTYSAAKDSRYDPAKHCEFVVQRHKLSMTCGDNVYTQKKEEASKADSAKKALEIARL